MTNQSTQKKTSTKKGTSSSSKTTTAPTTAPVTETPVTETPVTETPVTETPVTETPVIQEDFNDTFKVITSSLSNLVGELKTLTTEVKRLEKRVTKELKEAKKVRKGKKYDSNGDKPKRAPSGFAKPSDISEELCQFLGRPIGTRMARTEVTKHVTNYIRENDLQNPENKRHILPDKKLAGLLSSTNEDEVTYFNLQKYMKHHYPKSNATTEA